MPIVYTTREITPENLVWIYRTSGVSFLDSATVKIPTGEPGGHSFLQPELIGNPVQELMGTIAKCNTAYEGRRNTPKTHWEIMQDHEFTAITPCDILDEEGHMPLPVTDGYHLTESYVGSHLQNYDSMLMPSHFKGHITGGFSGALKNVSIGPVPSYGKTWIHSSGTSTRFEDVFTADHDSSLESMADADRSVVDYMDRENIMYINTANRLSVDCDRDAHPHDLEMGDIGTFTSVGPVAPGQTYMDAVYASEDDGKIALIKRMGSRNRIYMVEVAHSLGLGSRRYELRCIDSYKN